ncbi:MAG TPA: penicillin-binding protein 2 [Alphaproteobacteria bacterium]|nr:penicillin-binding protein 2 [Alphaproteobacteria bacterium]
MSTERGDLERYRQLTRRSLVLGGLQAGMIATLVARMYYLQVVDSKRYQMLAEDNRISMRLIAPSRGLIVDRFGIPLANNDQNFRALIVSEQTPDLDRTLGVLSGIIDLAPSEVERIRRDIAHRRRFMPVIVRENLTWDQVSVLEVNAPDIPGVIIDVGEVRSYPMADEAAHLIGYVGAVSEDELDDDQPVLSLPGFKIGKSGIEKYRDEQLRGTAGTSEMEVNAYGREIRELSRNEGQRGHTVTLTIDAALQKAAHERLLQERSGAAVVMDAQTGAVYAFASAPGFDPNVFSRGIPSELWKSLLDDETAPLIPKMIAGAYPPGSTFKLVVALAGLESGAIGLDHHVTCNGTFTLGGHTFYCDEYKHGGHGTLGLVEGIAQSCDVYFYDVGNRTGIDAIAAVANRLGLGEKTGIDIPNEHSGTIPSTAWKKAHTGEPWYAGETISCAIGQGQVAATPLQIATMVARLSSGGYAVKPHLVKDVSGVERERTDWPKIDFKPEHLEAVLAGMRTACSPGFRHTGAHVQIQEPGMQMGGKTGTAQVHQYTLAERDSGHFGHLEENLPWKLKNHAWFVGYAPVDNPRYVCSVLVEHAGHFGAEAAGPVAHDLLLLAQQRDPARIQTPA